MSDLWFQAIQNRNTEQVLNILAEQPDLLHTQDDLGRTAAEISLSLADESTLRCLLDKGANATPLLPLALMAEPQLLGLLMEFWADIEEPIIRDNGSRTTALHLACECGPVDSVRTMLRYGAYTDSLDESGMSPLHIACRYLNPNVGKELLLSGANPRYLDPDGRPPIVLAALHGNDDMLNALILLGVDPYDQDFSGLSAINACMNPALFGFTCNYPGIMPDEEFGVIGQHSTHLAIQPSSSRAINIAVALSFCYDESELTLPQASFLGDTELVEQILATQPDTLNQPDLYGWTPLHIACRCRHEELAQRLLSEGAVQLAPCGVHVKELIRRYGLDQLKL